MNDNGKDAFLSAVLVIACLPFLLPLAYGFIVGAEPVMNPADWPAFGRLLLTVYEAALVIAAFPFFVE